MTPERWEQIRDLLHSAMQMEAKKRQVFLDQRCSKDPTLRQELDRLLAAEGELDSSFLESPAVELVASHLASSPSSRLLVPSNRSLIGLRLGDYEIIEEIGSGGMGEVYRGCRADDEYRKQVAIKLVRAGQDSRSIVQRFKQERQILASLDHPNIGRLLDGGTTGDGLPFFVMEFIEGLPIDRYCDTRQLGISERLRLFQQVCSAVQYAHQHGLIHRDLKPGNILVAADGVPKLLDFGIAKVLEPGVFAGQAEATMTICRALTPSYASPEQIKGTTITTASDIYSLGVVLYALLTGHSPYKVTHEAAEEMLHAVCEVDPEKPSTAVGRTANEDNQQALIESSVEKLSHRLRGDLDDIVLMALRKEPQRRYASAAQFSEDIQRHLENRPVIARKDTVVYLASKFVRRNKTAVAAAALLVLSVLAGMFATLRQARIAQAERARAEHRFNEVRQLANSLMFDIHDAIQDLPGSTPARKILIDKSLQYLDSLASESRGDASLRRELAIGV